MGTKKEELEKLARGEGCLGKAADDEPVFILRGQDRSAAMVVRGWAEIAEATKTCPPAKVAEARALADKMDAWPRRKWPD